MPFREMNCVIPRMCGVFCILTILSLCSDATPTISTEGQLFSQEVQAKLSTQSLEYRDAIWPSGEELSKAIPLESISFHIVDGAEHWLRTMLKPQWIPEDIRDSWIALTMQRPFIPPQDVDYLLTRFETEGYQIQVLENGAALAILVVPPNGRSEGSSIESYIEDSARKYLNLPKDRISQIRVTPAPAGRTSEFFVGTIDCVDKNIESRRLWFHHSYVWSDGRCVYYGMVEIDPEAEEASQPHPGIRRRFSDALEISD